MPAFRIEPAAMHGELQNRLASLDQYRIGIFISRNAVQHTLSLLHHDSGKLKALTIMAIGDATAAALREAGINAVSPEDAETGSETLLQLPQLQAGSVQRIKILIFRGTGGRELLADTLRARGAQVDYASVYRREPIEYSPEQVDDVWLRQKPDLIVASSTEGLQNLLKPAHGSAGAGAGIQDHPPYRATNQRSGFV
jgi:uroporphyrinogen-III synthase